MRSIPAVAPADERRPKDAAQFGEAKGAHISVHGHITMSEFRRRTVEGRGTTDTHNGMLNRFLVMYSMRERIVTRPMAVPHATRAELANMLATNVHGLFFGLPQAVDHTGHRKIVLHLTEDALALWDAEYPRITAATYDSEYVSAMMARRELHTLVVAALLAALNGESAVGVEPLRAGLAWLAYVADTTTRVFATLEQRKKARLLRGWVAKLRAKLREKGDMTLREIQQTFNKSAFKPHEQHEAIKAMVEASPPLIEVDGRTVRLTPAGKAS